jgi:hypothetical protein
MKSSYFITPLFPIGFSFNAIDITQFQSLFGLAIGLDIFNRFGMDGERDKYKCLYDIVNEFLKHGFEHVTYYTNQDNIYPADWDDLAWMLLSIHTKNKVLPPEIIKLLTMTEYKSGGPYYTWISNTAHNSIDLYVNIVIFRMLLRYGIYLGSLWKWIIQNWFSVSLYYPNEMQVFLKALLLYDVQSSEVNTDALEMLINF